MGGLGIGMVQRRKWSSIGPKRGLSLGVVPTLGHGEFPPIMPTSPRSTT